jgi:membrane associated rhomboid family serine protease
VFGGEMLFLLVLVGLFGVVVLALAAPLIPVRRRSLGAFPVVSIGLIVLNVLLYFGAMNDAGYIAPGVVLDWGLTPSGGGARGVTLLTYNFLHGDFLHLLGNMLGLYLFGPHVEEALAGWSFCCFIWAAASRRACSTS